MSTRRTALTCAVLAATTMTTTLLAAPASAAPDKPDAGASPASVTGDQTAEYCGDPRPFGAMCYFFRSNYGGAQAGFVPDVPDLLFPTRWLFPAPGDGAGQQVANNAGSGHNRDTSCNVTIYFHANYTGDSITLIRGTSHPTLGVVNNENRSHDFHNCV